MSKNSLLLNMDDFVRVVQTSGDTIEGRYDGKNYEFPDAQTEVDAGGTGYRDVHKDVAQHIFGFGLPEDVGDDQTRISKQSALLRLGWISGDSSTMKAALTKLRTKVRFLEIPPFPTTVLDFKKAGVESAGRVPSQPPMGQEGGGVTPDPSALTDPFAKKGSETLTLKKTGA